MGNDRLLKRDPERIKRILFLLEAYWKKNSDLRLAQIISNLSNQAGFSVDLFYFEDSNLEHLLLKELELENMVINSSKSED